MLVTIVDAIIMTFISYSIIIYCNVKIIRYLKHHEHSLSATARRVQHDLNKVLWAQAIIPIFSAFLPMSLHIGSAIADFDFLFASFIGGLFYAWIPVGNALSVLIFVTAYREKLKQLILHSKPRLPSFISSSVTSPAVP